VDDPSFDLGEDILTEETSPLNQSSILTDSEGLWSSSFDQQTPTRPRFVGIIGRTRSKFTMTESTESIESTESTEKRYDYFESEEDDESNFDEDQRSDLSDIQKEDRITNNPPEIIKPLEPEDDLSVDMIQDMRKSATFYQLSFLGIIGSI